MPDYLGDDMRKNKKEVVVDDDKPFQCLYFMHLLNMIVLISEILHFTRRNGISITIFSVPKMVAI